MVVWLKILLTDKPMGRMLVIWVLGKVEDKAVYGGIELFRFRR